MRFANLCSIILTISAIQFFISCNDNPTNMGLGLLPSNELISVNSNDTINIPSSNVYSSLNEPLPKGDTIMLGIYNDIIFGALNASLVTEFRPLTPLHNYKTKKIADSLFITLNYEYFKGGKGWIKLKIFQILDTLSKTTVYSNDLRLRQHALVEISVDFSVSPIQITLPLKYAQQLLNLLDSVTVSNDFVFRKKLINAGFFCGFYFLPERTPGPGAVATYNMDALANDGSLKNNMILYFHSLKDTSLNESGNKDDIEFGFSSYLYNNEYFYPKANLLNHFNYLNTKIYDNLNGTKNDSVLFIQSAQGVQAELNMAGLENLKNRYKNKLFDVTKAELVIPYDTIFYSSYIPNITSRMPFSTQLVLRTLDKNGNITNYSTAFKPFYDGFVNGLPDTKRGVYILNISQYVQEYLNGITDVDKLLIEPVSSNYTLSSTIIKRGKNIRLNINYLTFNKN